MISTRTPKPRGTAAGICLAGVLGAVLLAAGPLVRHAMAQDAGAGAAETAAAVIDPAGVSPRGPAESKAGVPEPPADPLALAEVALAAEEPQEEAPQVAVAPGSGKINVLELLIKGGYLMLPIVAMSLLVVTFGLERFLGLRRRRILPPKLIRGLGQLAGQPGGLEPRRAYKLCQQYPSAAARVIRAMLLKVGRPHSEVEQAVREAKEREAARMYTNVRWLGLAAGVAPLLGLLGTVWGMIRAFMSTAYAPAGIHRAADLAEGIYVALVTTFAGLAVAIPAAVLAHLFEGRIQKLFRRLDDTLLGLLPQMERFEGKLRVRYEPSGQGKSRDLEDRGNGEGGVEAGPVRQTAK
jgi:biopolymer transport protein ExbB